MLTSDGLTFSSFSRGNLGGANLQAAYLSEANLEDAEFPGANLQYTKLANAYLVNTDLIGAKNLTINQLSEVKTLYDASLDDELLIPLKEKYPNLFKKP